MEQRRLGRQGPVVSAIGLGCMGMSMAYGEPNDEESERTIRRALDLGITHFDTSDMYGSGHNEELVGRAIAGRREEVVLATKFGNLRLPDGSQAVNGRPDYVPRACEASLRRLGVEVIDVYYLHRLDPEVPVEDTVGAMAELVRAGKVRHLGLSEVGPATLRRAYAVHRIAALQTEYSLWSRDVEAEILPVCRELGIGFVAYSPIGRGFLSGTIRDAEHLAAQDRRRDMPRFQGEHLRRNLALLASLERLAERQGCTSSQLALAWLLAKGEDVVPIPGTKRRTYLEENVQAVEVQLAPEEVVELDRAFPPDAVAGIRYPDAMLRRLGL